MHFGDANTGYAVGESGIVLKKTDAGQTWAKKLFPTNDNLYACWFISPTVGFVGMAGKIYKTTDGGTTWAVSATITGNKKVYSLYFPLSNVGYAVGEGAAYKYYVNTTAIDTELGASNLQIFPNPAQEEIHFAMENFASMGKIHAFLFGIIWGRM